MMKYARKNQLKQAEMQGNKEQIVQGETGSQKMTRQSKKQIENHSQSGRSMVEMLGVLAIIAILSIGGIVGFRLAMNYYQANQIAHEMNIMRTDAQIKIAQGTEELMLGDPYDSGNIQFNGYKTDFDCLDMETETSTPNKVVFCAVANAYYIELQEIPEGVCKPLANLIDNMDNEIAFYINGKSVDETKGEKGACNEEFNTLKVIFGADSDAIKCDDNTECASSENTPVCDKPRHVCVQCLTYNDCTDTPDTPQCDTNTNTCKSCYELNPNKPLWDGNECVECPDGQQWKESAHGCAAYECRTNKDCAEGKYCYLKYGASATSEWQDDDPDGENYSGECHYVSDDLLREEPTVIQNIKFYGSNKVMNWWTSCRFCAARAGKTDEGCVGMADGPSFMASYHDIDWKCYNDELASDGQYYCRETDANHGFDNVSSTIKEFRKMYTGDENYTSYLWLWLRGTFQYKGIELAVGSIKPINDRWTTRDVDHALCRE